jgi:hypothetical protein
MLAYFWRQSGTAEFGRRVGLGLRYSSSRLRSRINRVDEPNQASYRRTPVLPSVNQCRRCQRDARLFKVG